MTDELDRQARAQAWFERDAEREVSGAHDERETTATGRLSAAILMQMFAERAGRPSASFADVGCGGGEVLRWVAQQYPAVRLTGSDPVQAAVDAARVAVPSAVIVRVEGPAPGEVDTMLIHLCLGLWRDPLPQVAAAIAQLAPGGMLYLVDIDRGSAETAFTHATSAQELRYLGDQYRAAYDRAELHRLLTGALRHAEVSGRIHTGVEVFGGYGFGSPEQLALMGAPQVRDALRELAALDRVGGSAVSLVHGWVYRAPI